MLKFLLISILIVYVLYRVGHFIFKILFITATNAQREQRQYRTNPQPSRKKAPNSNLNIDYDPHGKNASRAERSGDYVDYEEIKDN